MIMDGRVSTGDEVLDDKGFGMSLKRFIPGGYEFALETCIKVDERMVIVTFYLIS